MVLLLSLSFVTMTLFCLAMEKHRKQIFLTESPRFVKACFRPLAWLMLLITVYLSVSLYGWSIGPAVFFGALSGSLVPLIFLITFRANFIPLLAVFLTLFSSVNILV
ncbi:MAG: hypothetical protein ACJA0T_000265 [Colwellia sp.]|jgi:hypothetical protein